MTTRRLPALAATALFAALAPAAAFAGPIFITGHDPDFHSQGEAGANNLLRKSLGFVRGSSAFPGKPLLWVESRVPVAGGHRRGRDGLSSIGLVEGADYVWMDGAALASLNWSALLDNYSAIAVASDFGGMLTQAELNQLNLHKAEIAAFFNQGGGIFACSEGNEGGNLTPDGGEYQFIPIAITSESSASPPYRVAEYGKTSFAMVDDDVSSPSHSHFTSDAGLNIVSWDSANHIMSLAGFAKIASGTGGGTGFIEGPIAQWSFDGNGDDSSGTGRHLTLAGAPGFAPGRFGQALDLHHDNSKYAIRGANDDLYNFGARDFTIQVWVNFYDTAGVQNLFEKFTGAEGPGWTLVKLPDNSWHFWARPSAVLYSAPQAIPVNVWHHVAVRRIGARFELFFNGKQIALADNPNPVPPTTAPVLIGKRNDADGRDYSTNGRIDEAAIWARGLSDGEIGYLYASGTGRTVDTHSTTASGNSGLDTLPDGTPIPNGAVITNQLRESAAATFTSTNGGAVSLTTTEASSPPSVLVGGTNGQTDSFQPITINVVDPLTGLPRTASEVFVNLISVGGAEVTASAFSQTGVLLDSVHVQHPGSGVGLNNVDPVTLQAGAIASVVVAITEPFPGDGFGIDDLYIVLGSTLQLNHAPSVDAGGDRTVVLGATPTAQVALTATGSDPDNDPLTYSWQLPGGVVVSGQTIQAILSLGINAVTVTAADGRGGTTSSTLQVTVVDTTPPALANVPASRTLEQAGPAGTAYVLPPPTASDNSGVVTLSSDAPPVFPAGATLVTFTAQDGSGNKATATATVTVRDTTPPVLANLPAPLTLEQATFAGTRASLVPPTATDACSTPTVTSNAPAVFPRGVTVVKFTARDAAGNESSATTTVTVRDTTAPTFTSLAPSTGSLWPPNHKLVPISIAARLSDAGDPAPRAKIVAVSSSEPLDGRGDGSTASDWVITGDLTVSLRAERAGGGPGRVYTITVRATDDSGNARDAKVTVGVAHDQGK